MRKDLRYHHNNREGQGSLAGFALDSLFKYNLPLLDKRPSPNDF